MISLHPLRILAQSMDVLAQIMLSLAGILMKVNVKSRVHQ